MYLSADCSPKKVIIKSYLCVCSRNMEIMMAGEQNWKYQQDEIYLTSVIKQKLLK